MGQRSALFLVLFATFAVAGCVTNAEFSRADNRQTKATNEVANENRAMGERLSTLEERVETLSRPTPRAAVELSVPQAVLEKVDTALKDNQKAYESLARSIRCASPKSGLHAIAEAMKGWKSAAAGSERSTVPDDVKQLLSDLTGIARSILNRLNEKPQRENPVVREALRLIKLFWEDVTKKLSDKASEALLQFVSDWFTGLAPAALVGFGILKTGPPDKGRKYVAITLAVVIFIGLGMLLSLRSERRIEHLETTQATILSSYRDAAKAAEASSPPWTQPPVTVSPTELTGVTSGLDSIHKELKNITAGLTAKPPTSRPCTCAGTRPAPDQTIPPLGTDDAHAMHVYLVEPGEWWWWLTAFSIVMFAYVALLQFGISIRRRVLLARRRRAGT